MAKKSKKTADASSTVMAEALTAAGVETVSVGTSTGIESKPLPAEIKPAEAPKAIQLTYERINTALAGWSASETRDAMATVNFAIEKMVEGAESKMAVGTKFNAFAEKHGDDKARLLIKETATLGINGLSENNIALWRKRSAMLLVEYPNPLIRRYVLALTGGEGIIVRDESFEGKDGAGKDLPKPYILSPFYSQAAEKHAEMIKTAAETTSEDVAEKVARTIYSTAAGLRTSARNKPEDARVRDAFKSFRKRLAGWTKKHETLVWDEMLKLAKAAIQETDNLDLVSAFASKVDLAAAGQDAVNGTSTQPQPKGKVA